MHIGIYSLKNVFFEGDAESVNCKTETGEITVLDHHRPLVSELKAGVIRIIDKNKKEWYVNVSSGFLKIDSENQVKFLVEENANARVFKV